MRYQSSLQAGILVATPSSEHNASNGTKWNNIYQLWSGMSMGHSVAVKAIDGVKNALSITIPKGTGVHRRMSILKLKMDIV